jgi:transcriptional regulator with XRE-family HTH domain
MKSCPAAACVPAFSFVCIEGATEMPESENDHEALAAGLDIDIGRRVKLRRIQLGLSPSDLARKIGPVAWQQVQKYENGTDRVSASRLYLIAEALGVGIGFFYGLDDAAAGIEHRGRRGLDRLLGRAVPDRGPRMLPRHDARTAQHLR